MGTSDPCCQGRRGDSGRGPRPQPAGPPAGLSLAVPSRKGPSPVSRLTAAVLARSLESVRQCGVALCIALGFSILMASRGSAVVRDRVTGAKRLQHISGLGHGTYWFTNFLYDMVGLGALPRHPAPAAC